jgi:hypothetical protein
LDFTAVFWVHVIVRLQILTDAHFCDGALSHHSASMHASLKRKMTAQLSSIRNGAYCFQADDFA